MTDQPKPGERDEHGFLQHNIDHIAERTATIVTGRQDLVDHTDPEQPHGAAIVAELESLKESIMTVTMGSVDQVYRWLMSEIDGRIARHRS